MTSRLGDHGCIYTDSSPARRSLRQVAAVLRTNQSRQRSGSKADSNPRTECVRHDLDHALKARRRSFQLVCPGQMEWSASTCSFGSAPPELAFGSDDHRCAAATITPVKMRNRAVFEAGTTS